jgi:hypothetical protein
VAIEIHLLLLFPRKMQHLTTEIASDDLGSLPESFGSGQSQITRPGTNIQKWIPGLWV